MTPEDIHWLRVAITVAEEARQRGDHPFGAVLVSGAGQELVRAGNTVVSGPDITGHAETNLVRLIGARWTAAQLAACTLYASTEPCAMCSGAIHWSGIGRVVFALSELDLYDLVGLAPDHLLLSCRDVFAHTARPVAIEGPCAALDAEARQVHAGFWR
jgi:tRNA(Arg) A34 adenosine deaminase TadA